MSKSYKRVLDVVLIKNLMTERGFDIEILADIIDEDAKKLRIWISGLPAIFTLSRL